MKLSVWFLDECFAVVVIRPYEHYVSDLKILIEKASGIPRNSQTLTCGAVYLEDDKMLKDYALKPSSIIVLTLPVDFKPDMNITVKISKGDNFSVRCRHNCTVDALKRLLHKTTKIPVDQQALTYKMWLLDDDAMELASYGIHDNSLIRLQYFSSSEFSRNESIW